MLTDDKSITTAGYWAKVYNGESHGKVDNSNTKRPKNYFDRFQWLANQVEGPYVLDVASGHAVTCKRIKAMHPDWEVIASDQTPAAMNVTDYRPYIQLNAYALTLFFQKHSAHDSKFTTITISQALEYLDHPNEFMRQARQIAHYFVCTVPEGEMEKWSQLRIYEEHSFKGWLREFGNIEHFDKVPGLMLAKIKF